MTIGGAVSDLYNLLEADNIPFYYKPTIKKVIETIEQDAIEQRTGHWEWVQYDGNLNIGNWHCSECRSIVIPCVKKNEEGGIPLYKYCPQCGAKIE